MLLSSPKAGLITFFQDSFNKTLSQQLTHDRSYISQGTVVSQKGYLWIHEYVITVWVYWNRKIIELPIARLWLKRSTVCL